MKTQILSELERDYDSVHGCYKPAGGPCFYIASDPTTDDGDGQKGRVFFAVYDAGEGEPAILVVLAFLVGRMARMLRTAEIDDFEEFCREVGLARLRESLDRDFETERSEKIFLERKSPAAEFLRPPSEEAIYRYSALKDKIQVILATLHAKGEKRVPKDVLLDGLCDDLRLINRALNELVELELLRDLNHSDGIRLTAEGQQAAESLVRARRTDEVGKQMESEKYDFFVSYASEDRDLAEGIDGVLSERGYAVWRDRGRLTLGDSLTEKIGEGLAQSRYAVVILSPAFLQKNWPKSELQALQWRAISSGRKVILPIRKGLSHNEMAEHLPLLRR